MSKQEMTPAYALLSLRAGCLATVIDAVLGDDTVIQEIRAHAWDLSDAYLEQVKTHAVAKGVDLELLEAAEARARELFRDPALVQTAIATQKRIDQAREN
jgi:hypothetical protein